MLIFLLDSKPQIILRSLCDHHYKDDSAWTWHLKNCNPGVSDVVERDGVVEWIGVGSATGRVVAIPVDTRLITVVGVDRRRPVGDRRRRVTACSVDDERQQVDTL